MREYFDLGEMSQMVGLNIFKLRQLLWDRGLLQTYSGKTVRDIKSVSRLTVRASDKAVREGWAIRVDDDEKHRKFPKMKHSYRWNLDKFLTLFPPDLVLKPLKEVKRWTPPVLVVDRLKQYKKRLKGWGLGIAHVEDDTWNILDQDKRVISIWKDKKLHLPDGTIKEAKAIYEIVLHYMENAKFEEEQINRADLPIDKPTSFVPNNYVYEEFDPLPEEISIEDDEEPSNF